MLTGKIAQQLIARLNELVSADQLAEPTLLDVSVSWKLALKPQGRPKSPRLQRRTTQSSFTHFDPSLKENQTPTCKETQSNTFPRLACQRSYFSISWTHRSAVQLNWNQVPIWGQLPCCKCCHSHCHLQKSSSVEPSRMRGTLALWGRVMEQGGFSVWDIQQNPPSWHFFTTTTSCSSLAACKWAPSTTPHVSKRHLVEHITSYTPGRCSTDISHLSPWPTSNRIFDSQAVAQSLSSSIPHDGESPDPQPLPLHALWASNTHTQKNPLHLPSCALRDNPDLRKCFEIWVARAEHFSYYVPCFT